MITSASTPSDKVLDIHCQFFIFTSCLCYIDFKNNSYLGVKLIFLFNLAMVDHVLFGKKRAVTETSLDLVLYKSYIISI